MASPLSSLTNLPEDSVSAAIGYALGTAAGASLTPPGTVILQDAWKLLAVKVHDPASAATLVAQGLQSFDAMAAEALQSGMSGDRFAQLVQATLSGPDYATLLSMARRGTITPQQFTVGLRKIALDPQWDPATADQQMARLSVNDLALMIQRGIIPDAGILPVAAPTGTGNVPAFPVFNIDAVMEAAASGYDKERFAALVGRTGLSMAPNLAAQGFYRGHLQLVDFHRAIAEGDLRNEWADSILEVSRAIPTAVSFAEAQVRGQITAEQRAAGTELHGMKQEHSDLLYQISGRGLAPHLITTGLARGAKYPGSYDNVPEPYKGAIQRALTREEYSELAYGNRYNYPSAFLIRTLATTGEITSDQTRQLLEEIGWDPKYIDIVVGSWYGTSKTGADKHVAKAQTQLWTAVHKSYLDASITITDARHALSVAGVADAAVDSVLAVWDEEKTIYYKELSPAEIKKAYDEKVINPATGVAWTETDAIVALQDRGYSPDAALTLLEE